MSANRWPITLVASIAVSSGIKPQILSDDVREASRKSKVWETSRSFQRNEWADYKGAHWTARLFQADAHDITAARFYHFAARLSLMVLSSLITAGDGCGST